MQNDNVYICRPKISMLASTHPATCLPAEIVYAHLVYKFVYMYI